MLCKPRVLIMFSAVNYRAGEGRGSKIRNLKLKSVAAAEPLSRDWPAATPEKMARDLKS